MDPKLAYWTAAFVNLGVLMGVALSGVRLVRRGEVARHRRAMRIAGSLVVAFLLSYPFKLAFLGREDLASWGAVHVGVLRVHELCVLVMLLGGTTAFALGRRLARTAAVDDSPDAPPATGEMLARHRLAGRAGVAGAVLGWITSGMVLAGMYARS